MAAKVTIIKDGPALIEDEHYISVDNKVFQDSGALRRKIAICRCGLSENGVYCDGTHSKKSETNKNQENG